MKVGIMGGTFNPIHHGHLILAESAYEQMDLDQVLIMPLKNPPHKSIEEVSDEDRVKMVHKAIDDNPHFALSMIEINREGITYTADTLTLLKRENPNVAYHYIVGADSFLTMHKWKEPKTVFELSTILVAGRGQATEEELEEKAHSYEESYGARIHFLSMPRIEISSRRLREQVAHKKGIRYYVPDPVASYIEQHNLYR